MEGWLEKGMQVYGAGARGGTQGGVEAVERVCPATLQEEDTLDKGETERRQHQGKTPGTGGQ